MTELDPRDDYPPPAVPTRLVAVAYLLALTCLLVPLALLGALFAGAVLIRRDRRGDGIGVIAMGVACTAVGLAVLA